jgi:RNA polymerase sigma factor (sigma-70 family)
VTGETVEEAPTQARLDVAISEEEFEDARLGFFQLLRRKRMSRPFIDRHGDDLFAQAAFEFSRKVDEGERIENPAGWIIVCAWNRTKGELEAQHWRPHLVSTESVAEPVAAVSWQPEESLLTHDRFRKLREAVDQLPDHQRELLARSYLEGESVREAARQLGWTQAKAHRAKESARKKLRLILGDIGSEDLGIQIGLAAFLSASAAGRAAAADLPTGLEAAMQKTGHALSDGWRRAVDFARHPLGGGRPAHLEGVSSKGTGQISEICRGILAGPVAETAAAGDGPTKAAEICKVLAVCAISGTAVTAGIIGTTHGHPRDVSGASRPSPRRSDRTAAAVRAGPSITAPTRTPVEADPAPDPSARGARPEGSSSSTRSPADSQVATGASTKEKRAEEDAGSRQMFGAFGKRGEDELSGSGSTVAETDSLADTESTSAASTTSEGAEAAQATPKEAAEERAAGEQFHGALR